jgi:hypothetical protein
MSDKFKFDYSCQRNQCNTCRRTIEKFEVCATNGEIDVCHDCLVSRDQIDALLEQSAIRCEADAREWAAGSSRHAAYLRSLIGKLRDVLP